MYLNGCNIFKKPLTERSLAKSTNNIGCIDINRIPKIKTETKAIVPINFDKTVNIRPRTANATKYKIQHKAIKNPLNPVLKCDKSNSGTMSIFSLLKEAFIKL